MMMTSEKDPDGSARSWTNWFEIPATDMDRAKRFYETIFEIEIHLIDLGPLQMGIFPHKDVGCALCKGEHYTPSADGVTVSMNANPDLQPVLDRVAKAGGRVVQEKKQISPEYGYMALFIDSEGNRLALHSMG